MVENQSEHIKSNNCSMLNNATCSTKKTSNNSLCYLCDPTETSPMRLSWFERQWLLTRNPYPHSHHTYSGAVTHRLYFYKDHVQAGQLWWPYLSAGCKAGILSLETGCSWATVSGLTLCVWNLQHKKSET
jgi:hypothetical protein